MSGIDLKLGGINLLVKRMNKEKSDLDKIPLRGRGTIRERLRKFRMAKTKHKH